MSKASRATKAAKETTEELESPVEGREGQVSVTLPTFEGPLDLLLHLCQKHELDILDIPIHFVTEKYLEYLSVMTMLNLDVASEYLVMAATLAHIKSKMLLPTPPADQEDDVDLEEIDPREALIRRLLEYQKYKHAANALLDRGIAGKDVFFRGTEIEEAVHTGLPPLAEIPLFSLVEAFQHVLSKSKVQLTHDIVADRISITDRIHELVDVLQSQKRLLFEDLFAGLTTKFDLVITFLALLEMSRLRMTRLYQSEPLAPLYVEPALDGNTEIPTNIDGDDVAGTPADPSEHGTVDAAAASSSEVTTDEDEADDAMSLDPETADDLVDASASESVEDSADAADTELPESARAGATDDVSAPAQYAVSESDVAADDPIPDAPGAPADPDDEEAS